MILRTFLTCFALLWSYTVFSNEITLYATEFLLPSTITPVAQKTIDTVKKAIYPKQLNIKVLQSIDEIDEVLRSKEAPIAIVGATTYLRHRKDGMRDIATLISNLQPDPDHSVGALVVVKKDSNINSLKELKGKRLGANHPDGFQGLTVVYKELADQGYAWDKFFSKIKFYGLDPYKRIAALQRGEVDAITLNACFAEREAQKGRDVLDGLKPVNVKENESAKCLTSKSLYPSWSFLVSPHLDTQTIVNIANALYAMQPTKDGERWTIASDFRSVDELFKTLKRGPYAYLNEWTAERIWKEHGNSILLLTILFFVFVWHYFRTRYLVTVRTAQLRKALVEQKKLLRFNNQLRDRYDKSRRALIVSQLSSLFAHELSQPLSGILLYLRSLKRLLKQNKLQEGQINEALEQATERAKKAHELVQLVRSYAKSDRNNFERMDPVEVLVSVLENLKKSGELDEIDIRLNTSSSEIAEIEGHRLELEIVFSNILNNSLKAIKATKKPEIRISVIQDSKGHCIISFSDNGPGVSVQALEDLRMTTPLTSTTGLGLGLTIAKGIVEEHRGKISFTLSQSGSLIVEVILPLLSLEENTEDE